MAEPARTSFSSFRQRAPDGADKGRSSRSGGLIARPHPRDSDWQRSWREERRNQLRGLIYLALAVLLFSLLRAGLRNVFTPAGWWRVW
jgi:hypothetical protein